MNRLAAQAIADLDVELSRVGEPIKLGRLHDAPDGRSVSYYAENVPAKVIRASPQEITGSFPNSTVIISPSRLADRQSPAPPRKDDRIWIADAVGVVETVTEQRVQGVVVRYRMECRS
jgi:hypothetical protein